MFSKSTSSYQHYIELGKQGGTLTEFYYLLPKAFRRKTKSGHIFFGDAYAVQYFAFGLVHGGHLDKLLEFYSVSVRLESQGIHYAEKILEHGLRAALHKCDLYLYEEVKHMHHDPAHIESVLKANLHQEEKDYIDDQLKKIDEIRKQIKPPYDLIKSINHEIKIILWNDIYLATSPVGTELWKDNTSRYPDKYHVLIALKQYLFGALDIDQLTKVIEANPKYDKKAFSKHSQTGKLLKKALLVKGETLSITKRHHH